MFHLHLFADFTTWKSLRRKGKVILASNSSTIVKSVSRLLFPVFTRYRFSQDFSQDTDVTEVNAMLPNVLLKEMLVHFQVDINRNLECK